MQFQANRASGGAWFTTVRTTLQRLHDRQALESFGVTVSMSAPPLLPQDPDASEQWFLGECKMIEKYWRVLIEISSARSWSQIQFSTCQPNSLAVVLLEDRSAAQAGLDVIKEVWDAVLAAERAAASDSKTPPADRAAISGLLLDVAWNRLQTARESWLVCEQGKWLASDASIRLQAEHLFSGPANTKWDLEDLFAHLASIARSSNLPTAMNKPLACTGPVVDVTVAGRDLSTCESN